MRKQTNTLSPNPKGFQSPKFSDSDVQKALNYTYIEHSSCNSITHPCTICCVSQMLFVGEKSIFSRFSGRQTLLRHSRLRVLERHSAANRVLQANKLQSEKLFRKVLCTRCPMSLCRCPFCMN
jgi:hypothetical protein